MNIIKYKALLGQANRFLKADGASVRAMADATGQIFILEMIIEDLEKEQENENNGKT